RRGFILGSARAVLTSLLSLSTISAGVAFGTPTPYQELASKPGKNSATVGTSASASERAVVVTANPRSFPVLTYSIVEGAAANMDSTCPPISSARTRPPPRYGTGTTFQPARSREN